MLEILPILAPWHWLTFGIALIAIEVLGAGGYLLMLGTAAVVVGSLAWAVPGLPPAAQYIAFSSLAVTAGALWWRRQRAGLAVLPVLNERGQALIGRRFVLVEAIAGGRGRVIIGDASWLVSGPDLPVGTEVIVTALDGMVLQVEAARDHQGAR